MSKKLTTEEFIEKAKAIHGYKYDYSEVEYKGINIPIKIKCLNCNTYFYQKPVKHLCGHGCTVCNCKKCHEHSKLTTEEFVSRLIQIHGDKYDYSEVKYINYKTKVKIWCKACNKYFYSTPNALLFGSGCRDCSYKFRAIQKKLSLEEFIEKARAVHGNKYDYSLVEYKDAKKCVKIKCNKCGRIFEQTPNNHIRGQGCSYCNGNFKDNDIKFLDQAKKVHGDTYDYSSVKYINNRVPVKIKCNKCGKIFEQIPQNHVRGQGCPFCTSSHNEDKIAKFLDTNCIKYKAEYTFKECKNKRVLHFDFYLPDYNICIEFQGRQHYKEGFDFYISYNKGNIDKAQKAFENAQKRDQIKREYCKSHSIELIEIRYDEDINLRLNELLTRLQKDNKHE